jgi:hypothetical protein
LEVPDITQLAVKGVSTATDESLRLEAKSILLAANKPGSQTTLSLPSNSL